MTPVPASHASPSLAALAPWKRRAVRIVFWGNLICQMGIIVTGGVVRLSKSGLGCTTWPSCEPGQFTPRYSASMGIRPFIEFGNRTLTGVLGIFAIALLVVTILWLRGKGRSFVLTALLPLVGTAAQAIVGMVVVKLHLHPVAVAPHFLISIVLVVVSAVLVVRVHDGDGRIRRVVPAPLVALSVVMAVVSAAVLLLGTLTTNSGPHSGDIDATMRLGLDPRTVSWLHADSVMLFSGLLVGLMLCLYLMKAPRRTRRTAWLVVAVTALQAVIGYTQYFTGLPEVLVGLHMTGAALFTAAVTAIVSTCFSWTDLAESAADVRVVEPSEQR
ncbi:heme A synthase [Brachybacterium endophyticum]|uniref:Heme A synthase n=1 Tax=Brachybacterium endophyticum TaxID=2182385 RepID=A0A2U2RIV9_9MICO|nr:COX15/CtaA family protein [Brachybacterium endophyticum]PWH05822.1 heme A synthase [Brachybacterium endophyticum]